MYYKKKEFMLNSIWNYQDDCVWGISGGIKKD